MAAPHSSSDLVRVQPRSGVDTRVYADPQVTVDLVLMTLHEGRLCVLLVPRDKQPERGRLALPGGFVHLDDSTDPCHPGEDHDLEAAARRVLLDKAGVTAPYLEQLYTFSGRARDTRRWSISVGHFALVPASVLDAAKDVHGVLVDVDHLPSMPFDHADIVAKAVLRLRSKATYSSLPLFLLPDEFTLRQMQDVYALMMGVPLDTASFTRKVKIEGMVEPVPGRMVSGRGRSSQLYRRSEGSVQIMNRAF